jgi:hypothetical protein
MSNRSIATILALATVSVIVFANIAYAADSYVELAPLCDTSANSGCGTVNLQTGLGTYINNLYKIAVAAASVLAVLMLVLGGFKYVSTDVIGNKEEGKETIKSALGGLLLVLSSWVILNTINPQLVSLNITSKALESKDLSDLLSFANQTQATLNELTAETLLNDARSKKDTRSLQARATSALSEVATWYDFIDYYNSGQMTDEEAVAIFGTAEPAEINQIIETQQAKMNQIKSNADKLNQEAEVIETVNRANAGIVSGQKLLLEESSNFGEGFKWMGYLDQQEANYKTAATKIKALSSVDQTYKDQQLAALAEKVNKVLHDMCDKLANTTAASTAARTRDKCYTAYTVK